MDFWGGNMLGFAISTWLWSCISVGLALKLWILGRKRQVTPVERLGECGVSTKNVASESASGHNFWWLGCRMFCLFVVCFDLVQLTFTYFDHSTHHQAEPLLCGGGYNLWPCKTDHKIRKAQRCSSFAFLGGNWSFFSFRVCVFHMFPNSSPILTHENFPHQRLGLQVIRVEFPPRFKACVLHRDVKS